MPPSSPSAVPQRIPWRKRADLQSVPLEFDGQPAWGVKDPITLGYFELSEEAYFVLNQLDGQNTSETICTAFHQRFRPRTLSPEELRGFIGQLVSQGLVVAETSGHGRILVAQGEARNARRRWMKLTSLLAVRFRGFDPDRLLSTMLSGLGWIFSPWAMGFAGLLIVSAVTLIAVQFDELRARMPETQALLTVPNLIWLSLLLAIVKVLHEFGHGLTCKKFGGECHELGVMLLVFTPTLYCNVSDIWMIRDKWRRIAVSAAGMWVEAVIAAACTLMWWFSAPGLFHSLCLNLMFLCGVSTFLFNGNPLLRYDGYFVLADWLEIPNLQQQASATVRSQFSRWFCGFEEVGAAHSLSSQRRWGLLAYGIASSAYRIGLTYFIVWGVYHWLQPYGLGALAQLLAVPTVILLVVTPLATAFAFFRSPDNRRRIHWFRFWLSTGCTLFALGWLIHTPWPRQISAEAIVDDDTAQRVYVTLAGTLVESAAIGQHVNSGQIIARLEEPRLLVAMTQLEGELNQHQMRLKHLEQRRVSEPNVAQNIPSVREAVRDLEQQVEQRRRDAERLVLRAPQAGTVLPAAPPPNLDHPDALPTWTGSPLDERNRGCYLQEGTTLCLIGPAQSQSAVLMVNQDDINLVRIGQRVRIQWNELRGIILEGEITELSALDLGSISSEAVVRLQLPHRVDSRGGVRPVGTWYQARVQLDATEAPLLRGAVGKARIRVAPQSLWQRLMRWLAQTFSL